MNEYTPDQMHLLTLQQVIEGMPEAEREAVKALHGVLLGAAQKVPLGVAALAVAQLGLEITIKNKQERGEY